MKKYLPLILCLAIPTVGIGGLSALVTQGSMSVYAALPKPPLSPPGWLFPIVWTILFLLMGYASWLVWRTHAPQAVGALWLYGAQLAVNFLWSVTFFTLRYYAGAMVVLLVLLVLIGWTTRAFWRIARKAGWLMTPYLLWTIFAGYLNMAIVLSL